MGKGANTTPTETVFKWSEVRKHSSRQDAWIVIRDSVYDLSSWTDHPGGEVLFRHAGQDASDVFSAFHPSSASTLLAKFRIGAIEPTRADPKVESFQKDYRELRNRFRQSGYFEASLMYYAWKVSSNVLILASAVALVLAYNQFATNMLSALLLGLFWQQCGWLAHDFLHHQVFKTHELNNLMGILVGNIFQGFSVDWWKTKHNTHHALPNVLDNDPDIDTFPLLAWSREMAIKGLKEYDTAVSRFLLRAQAYLFFPFLTFARLNWAIQSFIHVIRTMPKNAFLELTGLTLHWTLYAVLMYNYMSFTEALIYFVVSQGSCGLMLALVFSVGHNGMEVFPDKSLDFWSMQVLSTRDIENNWFIDWFMGGLQYQVEHHLFPTMPRHHLGKTRKEVIDLCTRHGIKYYMTDLWTGTVEVLETLHDVSKIGSH
eukprot:TRINITY_DN687_c0_g1_i2.p1 TRINITY_DN687_c0_g1~~TRINITY_DN687_c0_g1_i2.p1  ORF type:complete len:429 (+),score=80.78 TRINITY_DN687_c0_g1_i2:138-1424(+)